MNKKQLILKEKDRKSDALKNTTCLKQAYLKASGMAMKNMPVINGAGKDVRNAEKINLSGSAGHPCSDKK